jgi:hypothetical protein
MAKGKTKKANKKQINSTSKKQSKSKPKPTKQTKKPVVQNEQATTSALTVVVEKVDSGSTPLPPKRPQRPKEYPGNQRFVMGQNARTLTELVVVDRIANVKLCEAPMLAQRTERTDVFVKIAAILVRELEKLYGDRTFGMEAKDHIRAGFGKAITELGAALLY